MHEQQENREENTPKGIGRFQVWGEVLLLGWILYITFYYYEKNSFFLLVEQLLKGDP